MTPLYARRYLPGGRVAHAVWPNHSTAACGRYADVDDWRGSGTQDEYERAASLPPCRRCLAELGKGMPV